MGSGGNGSGLAGSPSFGLSACGLPQPTVAAEVAKPNGTPGKLTVVNWAGFKGAVTYTFDDANSSQIANFAKLQALGVHMTFYLQTNKGDAANAIWAEALKSGHELGNHTQTHKNVGDFADATAAGADVDAASAFIQSKFGVIARTMAAPYGDSAYGAIAQSRFLINRGVNNALIMPNDNSSPFNLPCYIPPETATASTFNAQIDSAASGGGWRVLLVHGFKGGSDGAYLAVAVDEFIAGVEHAKSLGNLWIDSMVNVGAYWRGQKLISTATPTTTGNTTTWNWTLPAGFPPGKCLRVTVDGGTLVQGDTALEWDSHGYYEIALDAGSVTLTP